MRRIYVVVVVVLIALAFFGGYKLGRPPAVNAESEVKIKKLDLKVDSLQHDLGLSRYRESKYKDTLKLYNAIITGVIQKEKTEQVRLAAIQKRLDQTLLQVQSLSIYRLDSIRWAWYPDSVTVSNRQHKPK